MQLRSVLWISRSSVMSDLIILTTESMFAVSGFRLEPFKTHFETLGFKRCANGWIAEVNHEDDPEMIKDNLMDLCDHKKAEFVVRSSFDEMLRHSRKSD